MIFMRIYKAFLTSMEMKRTDRKLSYATETDLERLSNESLVSSWLKELFLTVLSLSLSFIHIEYNRHFEQLIDDSAIESGVYLHNFIHYKTILSLRNFNE